MSAPVDVADTPLRRPETATLKAAFGSFPSGVAALCAVVDGTPRGLVASSFSVGVSFEPALVLFSVQRTSTSWPLLRTAARIGVSVLGDEHDDVCLRLASRRDDRFDGIEATVAGSGALFVSGAPTWLECSVVSEAPAGDHDVIVLEVHALHVDHARQPLVYHRSRFRRLAG